MGTAHWAVARAAQAAQAAQAAHAASRDAAAASASQSLAASAVEEGVAAAHRALVSFVSSVGADFLLSGEQGANSGPGPSALQSRMLALAQAAATEACEAVFSRPSWLAGDPGGFRSAVTLAAARERLKAEVAALVAANLESLRSQRALRRARAQEEATLAASGILPADYASLAAAQAVAARRRLAEPAFLATQREEALAASAAMLAAAQHGFDALPLPAAGEAETSVLAALDAAMHACRADRRSLQLCLAYILGHALAFGSDDLDCIDAALRDTAPGALDFQLRRGETVEQGAAFAGFVAGAPRGAAAAARADALRLGREYASLLDSELVERERRTLCLLLAEVAEEWRASDAAGDAAAAAAAATPPLGPAAVAARFREAKMRALFPNTPWPPQLTIRRAQEAASRARLATLNAAAAGGGAHVDVPGLHRFGLPPSAEHRAAVAAAAKARLAAVPPPRPPPPRRPAAGRGWQSQWADGWSAELNKPHAWRPSESGSAAPPAYASGPPSRQPSVSTRGRYDQEGAYVPPPPPPPGQPYGQPPPVYLPPEWTAATQRRRPSRHPSQQAYFPPAAPVFNPSADAEPSFADEPRDPYAPPSWLAGGALPDYVPPPPRARASSGQSYDQYTAAELGLRAREGPWQEREELGGPAGQRRVPVRRASSITWVDAQPRSDSQRLY